MRLRYFNYIRNQSHWEPGSGRFSIVDGRGAPGGSAWALFMEGRAEVMRALKN